MIRWTVFALLLANLGYLGWAYQSGHLDPDPWSDAPPPEAAGEGIEVLEVRTGADAERLRQRLEAREDPSASVEGGE